MISACCKVPIERKKDKPHVLFCTKCGKACFGIDTNSKKTDPMTLPMNETTPEANKALEILNKVMSSTKSGGNDYGAVHGDVYVVDFEIDLIESGKAIDDLLTTARAEGYQEGVKEMREAVKAKGKDVAIWIKDTYPHEFAAGNFVNTIYVDTIADQLLNQPKTTHE